MHVYRKDTVLYHAHAQTRFPWHRNNIPIESTEKCTDHYRKITDYDELSANADLGTNSGCP